MPRRIDVSSPFFPRYFIRISSRFASEAFIASNARKNEEKGLSVDKVVKLILKVDKTKNPKLSYTVGKDAFGAYLLSKLPQNLINKLVKFGLKVRMNL